MQGRNWVGAIFKHGSDEKARVASVLVSVLVPQRWALEPALPALTIFRA